MCTRMKKDPTRTRLSGLEFEYKVAGLVNARLHTLQGHQPELQLRYELATNVLKANPFDDIVLRIRWVEDGQEQRINYFVQQKHAEKTRCYLQEQHFVADVSVSRRRNLNLKKYFGFYKTLRVISGMPPNNLDNNSKIIRECALEEYRFVLYTTMDVMPGWQPSSSTLLFSFPFEDIFSTTDRGRILTFDENCQEIWNMMEGPDEDLFRREFLPRLRIFGGQAQASTLDQLIADAVTDAMGGHLPRADVFLFKYLSFLRDWWQSSEGDCLTQSTTELESIIRDDITDSVCTEGLLFQKRYCEVLAEQLQDDDASYIVVHGLPASLRHSKLKLTFGKILPRTYIIITESHVEEYPLQALLCVCEKLVEEVVLNVDCANERVLLFAGEILARRTCNLRIVSSKWQDSVYEALTHRALRCTAWSEIWALGHLEEIDVQRLLEAHVVFQGHELVLKELEEAWPTMRRGVCGATLAELATGATVTFGAPLPEMQEHYIPRELYHKAVLNRDVLGLSSCSDHFFLKGYEIIGFDPQK